jgi:hypothetical protein
MPQNETFAQAETRLREERRLKDEEVRKKHWADLLKNLRAANPSQTITYDGKDAHWRSLVVDGTEFRIELDEKRSGRAGDYHRVGKGVYYFVIGDWRRGGNRPRANEKKTGFDWAHIAQLVEGERKRLLERGDSEARVMATRKTAAKALDTLFRRRRDLEDNRLFIGVSDGDGTFTYTVRGMDVATLEKVMDIAKKFDSDNDGLVLDDADDTGP